jgi:hypothetical protein
VQRETLTGQLSEATERVLAVQQRHSGKKDGLSQGADHGNEGGRGP